MPINSGTDKNDVVFLDEYYSVVKKDKLEVFKIGKRVQLETIFICEINQIHMCKHCIVSFMEEIEKLNKIQKVP